MLINRHFSFLSNSAFLPCSIYPYVPYINSASTFVLDQNLFYYLLYGYKKKIGFRNSLSNSNFCTAIKLINIIGTKVFHFF